ncbi:response regulator transcription factor [Methylophaga sp.]|jgi:DNA-binding NarL/FixJ family response regulator|uniref:LuxR C-terminal-related transcriptional regulator n=1 Tax=Methylophaga sp. TaxID=2024840 RepID=UPI001400F66D|nr:response regulator transcription factor [Methylophaga sp.]MTI64065.1 response regulator transcription factor [Methylophaga sp.]
MKTILIVEDSEATRHRLEEAITGGGQFELIGSVSTYNEALSFIRQTPPDILLTDLDLPDGNGVDLIKLINLPVVRTELAIVITVFGDGYHVIEALKAGASGYLLKDDNFMDINEAISQMVEGGAPISPSIARYLLNELSMAETATEKEKPADSILSPREKEVLLLVSKGYTSKEIAKTLDLSYYTVREYVSNVYKKLSVKNKMQAVSEATLLGII